MRRYEAFHVFKIFVANPHKEGRVRDVLLRNQAKLLEFMSTFQSERADEQFVEEKNFLVTEISKLQPADAQPQAPSGADADAQGAVGVATDADARAAPSQQLGADPGR